MRMGAAWLLVIAAAGCGSSAGPPTTDTSSLSFPTLAGRIEFLQQYVTFRRRYRDLDFRVAYQNNGRGLVPGPSEFDIRLVAAVPPEELASWVPASAPAAPPADVAWLADVPGTGCAAGVAEWYIGPGLVVGLDRVASVVVYRRWSR